MNWRKKFRMDEEEIKKKILGNYYDPELEKYYDLIPLVNIFEVEEKIVRIIKEEENRIINNLNNLFDEFSSNGYSIEQLSILKDFYQEAVKYCKE